MAFAAFFVAFAAFFVAFFSARAAFLGAFAAFALFFSAFFAPAFLGAFAAFGPAGSLAYVMKKSGTAAPYRLLDGVNDDATLAARKVG